MKTLSIETPTHGRVLLREAGDPAVVVIGFHGYMENAEIQMDRLLRLPNADDWTLVSVQGLHRFYRGRSEEIVASWMTRQDRAAMIADNLRYVDRVTETVAPRASRLVMLGFSQGVATAFRAGVRGQRGADLIAGVGGDVPPELLADPACRFPDVLLARGSSDDWYTSAKLDADLGGLTGRATSVTPVVYRGGHEWSADVAAAIAARIAAVDA